VGGGVWAVRWLIDLMIGCFNFILNLCVFLKRMSCHLMIGGQKTPPFCHDRMVAALFLFINIF
jgi:hypothetical protein